MPVFLDVSATSEKTGLQCSTWYYFGVVVCGGGGVDSNTFYGLDYFGLECVALLVQCLIVYSRAWFTVAPNHSTCTKKTKHTKHMEHTKHTKRTKHRKQTIQCPQSTSSACEAHRAQTKHLKRTNKATRTMPQSTPNAQDTKNKPNTQEQVLLLLGLFFV